MTPVNELTLSGTDVTAADLRKARSSSSERRR